VVEHYLDTVGVQGSTPCAPTNDTGYLGGKGDGSTRAAGTQSGTKLQNRAPEPAADSCNGYQGTAEVLGCPMQLQLTPEMVLAVLVELDAVEWTTSSLVDGALEFDGEDVVACQAARRLVFLGADPLALIDWAVGALDAITPEHTFDRTAELSACMGLRALVLAVRHGLIGFATAKEKGHLELLDSAALSLVSALHERHADSVLARAWYRVAIGANQIAYNDSDRRRGEHWPRDDEYENTTTRTARAAGELALHLIRHVYTAETATLDGGERVNSVRAIAALRALGKPKEVEPDRCECGASLARVVGGGVRATLCYSCDGESAALAE
jgi:hypothetical protein